MHLDLAGRGPRCPSSGQGIPGDSQSSWAMLASPFQVRAGVGDRELRQRQVPLVAGPEHPASSLESRLIPATAITAMKTRPTIAE